MGEKPILFSAPMVRALLDGRKTQTRRVVKPQPTAEGAAAWNRGFGAAPPFPCPYGHPGDTIIPAMPIPSLGRLYCADVYGSIWSRARDGETWRRLRGTPTSKGYLSVTPAVEGRYPTKLVHALVTEAFYGAAPAGLEQIRHLNGEQSDNGPENLDWGTQEDNWTDRLAHGRGAGEEHHAAKLSADAVAEIRGSALSQRALARRFGVSQATIWRVTSGRNWSAGSPPRPANISRWASRITLRITDVRVERLNDISEEDCAAEGVGEPYFGDGDPPFVEPGVMVSRRMQFRNLWNHINGPGSWDANPWCWAVSFERVPA